LCVLLTVRSKRSWAMLLIGIICLVLGYLLGIHVLSVIGIVLAVIGAILLVFGTLGHSVGGRRYWF
jgi:CDP-diglyceride synthetase